MGHFGRAPIRIAWLGLVLPALVLNYFGQGALLLREPGGARATRSTSWCRTGRCSRCRLATVATVIASQAVISGVFSLTHQAIQLGYLPRMTIATPRSARSARSTCRHELAADDRRPAAGLGFRSSSALASAYGIAVTGAMAIAHPGRIVAAGAGAGAGRCLRASARSAADRSGLPRRQPAQDRDGGWFPLAGRRRVRLRGRHLAPRPRVLRDKRSATRSRRAASSTELDPRWSRAGTAVFMTGNPDVVPQGAAAQHQAQQGAARARAAR